MISVPWRCGEWSEEVCANLRKMMMLSMYHLRPNLLIRHVMVVVVVVLTSLSVQIQGHESQWKLFLRTIISLAVERLMTTFDSSWMS